MDIQTLIALAIVAGAAVLFVKSQAAELGWGKKRSHCSGCSLAAYHPRGKEVPVRER